MTDAAPSQDASLSSRAREILRRADAQAAAARSAPTGRPAAGTPALPGPSRAPEPADVAQLVRTLEHGLGRAQEGLAQLSAALERAGQELGRDLPVAAPTRAAEIAAPAPASPAVLPPDARHRAPDGD